MPLRRWQTSARLRTGWTRRRTRSHRRRRRYDKGAADILELLTAELEHADAQQERVRCISEWRSARLRLLADAGALGRAGIEASSTHGFTGLVDALR